MFSTIQNVSVVLQILYNFVSIINRREIKGIFKNVFMKPFFKKKRPKAGSFKLKLSTINIRIHIILCCEEWFWAWQDVYQHPRPLPSTCQ